LTEYVEDYIQLPPDGVGKKTRAIKRPDNRYEGVIVPISFDGEVDLATLSNLLSKVQEEVKAEDWRVKIRNDEGLAKLDVGLSTRASEATLASVLDRNALVKKDILKELDQHSLGAGLSVDVDVDVPEGRCGSIVTLKATYDPASTKGVRLEVYTSPDGVDWDTDTDEIYDLPFEAGVTRQKPYIVPALHPNIRFRIINLDPTYPVTISLWRTFI